MECNPHTGQAVLGIEGNIMQTVHFSRRYVALPNIGGILSDAPASRFEPRAVRVSERLENAYRRDPKAQWVIVDLPDGQCAVTMHEAREMGLTEAVWHD